MAKEWGGVLYAADMAEGTRFCVWPAFGGTFTDQAHLTRQFHRHTGVTPARYREGWARVRRAGTADRAPADARLASNG